MSAEERPARAREIIRELAEGLDDRFDLLEVTARESGAGIVLTGFASSPALAGRLRERLEAEGLAPAREDLEVAPDGPEAMQVVVSVAHLRRAPDHRAELRNQAVLGEYLERLTARGEWFLVRTADGYLGWCDRSGLTAPPPVERKRWSTFPVLTVTARDVVIRSTPETRSPGIVRDGVFDSRLLVRSRRSGWIQVELPDGAVGWIEEGECRLPGEGPRYPTAEKIVAAAKRLAGVPYLWGGTSPKGFDCSGLVQRVYGHFGILLPRDADLQRRAVEPLRPGPDRRAGDLLFFGAGKTDHVAISLGGSDFLHASGWVKTESLNPRSPVYRADLREKYQGAGRPPGMNGSGRGE
ncbi:MAG: C40 family peptidase [Candidatus Eisenbacteria bacterium]